MWVNQLGWFDIRTARLTVEILRDLQSMVVKMIFVKALFNTTIKHNFRYVMCLVKGPANLYEIIQARIEGPLRYSLEIIVELRNGKYKL